MSVLYASTIRPFDAETLIGSLGRPDVAIVEPLFAGISAGVVSAALAHVPHRFLALGIRNAELHRYGSPAEHATAHGLDAGGIRRSLDAWLAQAA